MYCNQSFSLKCEDVNCSVCNSLCCYLIDRDFTWKPHIEKMHRQCMGNLAVIWLIPALPYQEVVVPINCTPSSGLLLSGLEQLWGNFDQACGENTKLCTQNDST